MSIEDKADLFAFVMIGMAFVCAIVIGKLWDICKLEHRVKALEERT